MKEEGEGKMAVCTGRKGLPVLRHECGQRTEFETQPAL